MQSNCKITTTKNKQTTNKGTEMKFRDGSAVEWHGFVNAVSLCHRKKTWRDDELSGIKRKSNTTSGLPNKRMVSNEYSR